MTTRNPVRPLSRCTLRITTRMLGGGREPDWLSIYCRLIKRILKIDENLRPFLKQQAQLYEKHLFEQQVQAALHRVYGPDSGASKSAVGK